MQNLQDNLSELFSQNEVSEQDQKTLYQNTEEQMCFADVHSQILSLMLRSRLMIGRIFRKQGLLINSFYTLKQSLENFKLFAEGVISGIEKGEEGRDKGSFVIPEMYGGSAAAVGNNPAGKGQKAPPAKAPAKPSTGKGKDEDKGDELTAQQEIERKRELMK